jgi:purine-binding chemotaxis protein CheW
MHDDLDVIGGSVSEEHQHLTFVVDKETFAIAVLDIKEIIEFATITRVPQMQSYMAGVTNVRGKVIPVIDLSDRLELGASAEGNRTCIIVETSNEGELFEVGLIVDAVDQVYAILPETTEQTPSFGTRVRKDFILRMAKIGDGFVSVLNLSILLSVDELSINNFTYETHQGSH